MTKKRRLDILVFQPDFSQYSGAYYQHGFVEELCHSHNVFRYGPRIEKYSTKHDIFDVLKICPFSPDLICFAAGWELEDWSIPDFDPHPNLRSDKVNIPKVMILNKEYKKLDKKFKFIYDNDIQAVFTVHQNYKKWREEVGVEFIHFPFAINKKMFNDHGESKKYAFGFSGRLHEKHINVRTDIKKHIFLVSLFKKPRYWGYQIAWKEGLYGRLLPVKSSYARLINQSKIWLSTPSAIDIVGTRFYEIMASKSLLFCNRHSAYEGLFEDKKHCIMFESDLKDFDDKLFYYIKHESERQEIVNRAYSHTMENHTWERRVEQFTDYIRSNLL